MKGVVYQNIKTSKKKMGILNMINSTMDFFESGASIGRKPLGIYFTSYIGHYLLSAILLHVAEDKALQEGILDTISKRQQELILLKGQIGVARKIGIEES
ncbi:hypothetical protein [Enterococcus sp. BWR-S5]|uniref:hypothetical protein n=1 Tax=Enterococcus sp. BWR-S5 TaxID=2787714 RepID=UPI001920480E|nr:hypothetical protein [Enterococcus sp. BWR-S5]MBL1226245.1 hypothetical protein [Enterococcus sp. BWR-S5]